MLERLVERAPGSSAENDENRRSWYSRPTLEHTFVEDTCVRVAAPGVDRVAGGRQAQRLHGLREARVAVAGMTTELDEHWRAGARPRSRTQTGVARARTAEATVRSGVWNTIGRQRNRASSMYLPHRDAIAA